MFCIVVFCFFKQKTSYEMRISDWSSDVCSSDLRSLHVHIPLTRTSRTKRTEDGAHLHAVRCSCGRAVRRFPRARPGPGTRSEFATLAVLCQIGRASCRV